MFLAVLAGLPLREVPVLWSLLYLFMTSWVWFCGRQAPLIPDCWHRERTAPRKQLLEEECDRSAFEVCDVVSRGRWVSLDAEESAALSYLLKLAIWYRQDMYNDFSTNERIQHNSVVLSHNEKKSTFY